MPYRKYYKYKRSYYKRAYKTEKQRKNARVATVGKVKKLVNSNLEKKFVITPQSYTQLIPDGYTQQLNIMGQGTDVGQRIGIQIRHKSVDIRVSFYQSASIPWSRVRCVLFWYRMETTTQPSASDIIQKVADADGNVQMYMDSCYNMRNEGKYKILYDKVVLLTGFNNTPNGDYEGSSSSVGGVPVQQLRIYKNLKDHIGQYFDGDTRSDMTKGYLGLLLLPDQRNPAQCPYWTMQTVLKYTDA